MDVITLSLVGLISAGAALFLTFRALPVRYINKLATVLDIFVTIALVAMFAGTLGGMIVAAVGGLAYSVALTMTKGAATLRERFAL